MQIQPTETRILKECKLLVKQNKELIKQNVDMQYTIDQLKERNRVQELNLCWYENETENLNETQNQT